MIMGKGKGDGAEIVTHFTNKNLTLKVIIKDMAKM